MKTKGYLKNLPYYLEQGRGHAERPWLPKFVSWAFFHFIIRPVEYRLSAGIWVRSIKLNTIENVVKCNHQISYRTTSEFLRRMK